MESMVCKWGRLKTSLCFRVGVLSRRFFYSGLDESRVRRLRFSGVTYNRPRGRDTFSLAFERRVQVLPLLGVGDMYTLPKWKYVSTKDKSAGDIKPPRVLVVNLLSLSDVEAAVPYPAAHPSYYTGWADEHLHRREETIADDLPFSFGDDGRMLKLNNRRQLRQNGDTSLLPGSFVKKNLPTNDSGDDGAFASYSVALCVDPFLDVERFRREEAQVEMISAYRNLLYEAVELPGGPADILRIPALSCDTCGTKFMHEIGKLNQQAIIKGFHRINNGAKEVLLTNSLFRVELYVPPLLLEQFVSAFLEEAWETPESTINPGRTALYPGLPPPRTLMAYDGWVGKRRELIDAIETEGQSLMRGPQYALDGREITQREVLTEIRVFGREQDEKELLERERATALLEGCSVDEARKNVNSASLRPGINQV